jgi:hypothetical protein
MTTHTEDINYCSTYMDEKNIEEKIETNEIINSETQNDMKRIYSQNYSYQEYTAL